MARSGSVSMQSHTNGHYQISKLVDLEPDGIRPYRARLEMIRADSQLTNMQTEWDSVPLVGDLVRSMAGQRYQASEAERREEVERKMAARVESQFERQAQPVLSRLNQSFAKRVLTPLSRLELQPEAVVERPADERMNVRLRLASDHQLSGHTPRPRAMAGSLASLQVHESMLNNVLGTKLRIVTGYGGSNEIMLAIERNEVQGACGVAWSSIAAQHPHWLANGFARIIAQLANKGHPLLDRMNAAACSHLVRAAKPIERVPA